jgi:ATP adenylyltransferase
MRESQGELSSLDELFAASAGLSGTSTVSRLPFVHALTSTRELVRVEPHEAAHGSLERYHALLRQAGDEDGSAPYNLLATRRWMLLVPRSRESHAFIEVNALAFAGAFLVRGVGQLATLRELGPLGVLREVGIRLP